MITANSIAKVAILFPGQGAQYPGMGRSLYNNSTAAKKIFDMAGDDLKYLIFEGSKEELNDTLVTQPAVYTVDMATWAAFREMSAEMMSTDEIVGMAGFSLGEYAAMTAAGIIPGFREGLDLVKSRSAFMAEAGRYKDGSPRGAMAAVIGNHDEILMILENCRGDFILEAVNYNSPTQIVIAGDSAGIEAYMSTVRESKKKLKVIPLPVSSAFHTSIMEPASGKIYKEATRIEFGKARYRLCLNLTGQFIDTSADDNHNISGENIPEVMSRQVRKPVYWQKTLETLRNSGANTFIELGPGKALSGFVKKTIPEADFYNVEDIESLKNTISAIGRKELD